MRNNNSTPVFDQTPGCKTVLGAATTNITPVSHKSFTITEDGDLILIRFHESPPLTRLIVPHREVWSFCPPWSPAAPVHVVLSAVDSPTACTLLQNVTHDSGTTVLVCACSLMKSLIPLALWTPAKIVCLLILKPVFFPFLPLFTLFWVNVI